MTKLSLLDLVIDNAESDSILLLKKKEFDRLPTDFYTSGMRLMGEVLSLHLPAGLVFHILNLALATFLHGFDIETLDDAPIDMTETGGITNIKATPLKARLTPRLSPGLYDLQ
ncbi:hypothetical protein POTOM_047675 [Populus tomentosa]|uniref:Uncharacterized protein n=1 Tax=Populus tomentosa TaxID=118781 RepID=A0A8X8C9U9_POPTO|nr:hypothetical protein POTOM_047675 [Populus tomentosa]